MNPHVAINPIQPTNLWCRSKTLDGVSVREGYKPSEGEYLLVVRIPDPRERTQGTDHNRHIGNDPHDKHGVMVDMGVTEIVNDLEEEPNYTR